MASERNQMLGQLAQNITKSTKTVQDFLTSKNIDFSFAENAALTFPDAPEEVLTARRQLVEDTQTLHDLALGPTEQLSQLSSSYTGLFAIRSICHFRIAEHVPLADSITYEALATAVKVDAGHLRRILRQAMLLHVFQEPTPGHIAHSASSRILAQDSGMHVMVSVLMDELLPATMKCIEAYEKYGGSRLSTHSGWNVANDVPDEISYVYWAKHNPEAGERFGQAVKRFNELEGWGLQYLLSGYDWSSIPAGGKVVDVGGGHGQSAIALAKAYSHLTFVVQDLEQTAEDGKKVLPTHLQDKVQFMSHDYFTEQPIKNADVYLIQNVLVDNSDERAAKLVEQIAAALKPGAKIIIRDGVLPEPGKWPRSEELNVRWLDIAALALDNGGHRDLDGWKAIFAMADPSLQVEQVNRPSGSLFTMMILGKE